MRDNIHDIGTGKYKIHYEEHLGGKIHEFTGRCDNFNPNGLSAFWNEDSKQLLLVNYREIMGLYPIG